MQREKEEIKEMPSKDQAAKSTYEPRRTDCTYEGHWNQAGLWESRSNCKRS